MAEASYGLVTTTDPASLLVGATAGAPQLVEADLGNGVTLYSQQQGSSNPQDYNQDDKVTITLGGSGQIDLFQQHLGYPHNLVQDNWYEIRVTYNGGPLTHGSVILRDVLDPTVIGQTQLPNHVGLASGLDSALILEQDVSNPNLLRGVFKLDGASNMVVNGATGSLKVLCNDISPDIEIDNISIFDITAIGAGGDLTTASNNWRTDNQTSLVNYYSSPTLFSDGNKVKWVNSTNESEYLAQNFTSNNITTPQITADGYQLKFTISDYSSGELKGYVNNKLGDAGAGTCEGFYFSGIQGDGTWIVKANFDGTDGSMTRNASANGTVIPSSSGSNLLPVNFTTSSGYDDKIVFSPANTNGLTCSIDNISLVDLTNTFVSGSVNAWNFTGFDNTLDNFIDFDSTSENITFTNSPLDSSGILVGTSAGSTGRIQVEQNINTQISNDSSYRIKFDHDLTDGAISGYYFNANGKGFRIPSTTGNATYDTLHVTSTTDKTADELSETFVLYIDSVSGGGLNGTLDNFSMHREYTDFVPQTVSFSEDVRGWTSFKSFIPESGLNLSKNYFTIKEGKLYRHHDEETKDLTR